MARKPTCSKCGTEYPAKRKALGYSTCLACGDGRRTFPSGPAYNKGPTMLITSRRMVRDVGKK